MGNKFYPYNALEFHINESIANHTHTDKAKADKAQAHFEASGLYQDAMNENDHDLKIMKIKKYKAFCKKNKIKAYIFKPQNHE